MSFSKWWSRYGRNILQWLLYALLVATVVLLIMLVWVTVKCIRTDNTGFEENDFNFTLYKNSRFHACSTTTTANVNCTVLFWQLRESYGEGRLEYTWEKMQHLSQSHLSERSLVNTTLGLNATGSKYDWCSLASCLRGYKVIPSEPYETAFSVRGIEPLRVWGYINISALFGLLLVRKLFLTKPHDREDCAKSVSALDWVFSAIVLGKFIYWVFSFSRVASDPQRFSPVSIIAWTVLWYEAIAMLNCPVACRYGKQRRRRIAFVALAVLAFAQWIASIYMAIIMPLLHETDPVAQYRCLEAEIPNAPGTSACSPQQLCSKTWLFKSWKFQDLTNDWTAWKVTSHYAGIFIMSSFAAWGVPLILILHEYGRSYLTGGPRPEKWYKWRLVLNLTVILSLTYVVVACVINASPAFAAVMRDDGMNREAVLAFDVDCTAVHVALSEWRYFLDVGNHNRARRVAKMWLNA